MRTAPASFVITLLLAAAGCSQVDRSAAASSEQRTLTIGFGIATGENVDPAVRILSQEGLVSLTNEGRLNPWLAQSWTSSNDKLIWRFVLPSGVTFHDGTPATAQTIRDLLSRLLPPTFGALYDNIDEIKAESPTELVVKLKRPSNLLIEGLNLPLHPESSDAGTGPFRAVGRSNGSVELVANEKYHEGRPIIDRVIVEPFSSVRSAWAEMLRGQVDMVYELGVDALNLMSPATATKIFTFQRPFAYVVLLNTHRAALSSPAIRRALGLAINRTELVANVLDGHGRPASGPVWPNFWAGPGDGVQVNYDPSEISRRQPPSLTLLYSDSSHERLAVFVQQQLASAGVDVRLEFVSIPEATARAQEGNFDAWLVDMGLGPGFLRQYMFWQSQSPYNYAHYSNPHVDAALDAVQQAQGDEEFKRHVSDFARLIMDDPPAIFLAWSERARAVSTRFDVQVEPGRDILLTLRSWRPAMQSRTSNQN